MEDNIEVKDVQKTEYLDKNGLDMLWTKVKENTHNQVEVEYNRAKAKEDSLSQEIASVKPDEGKSYIQAKLISKEQDGDSCSYDVAGNISFKSEYSDSYSGPITEINKNGIGINFDNEPTFGSTGSLKAKLDSNYNITMQGNGRLLHDTKDTFNQVSISLLDNVDTTYANSSNGNSMLISQLGIFYTSQGYALTSNDLLTGHGSYKTIGTDIAPLENGKVPEEYLDLSQYAKKTDIPEVDTSDFVSKSDTITQTINSGLIAMNELNVFSKGYYDQHASLRGGIIVEGADTKLMLNDTTAQHNCMVLTASKLSMSQQVGDNTLLITTSGIANTDNNANHVYATDGSIADLTQYAKKSEITAGSNVNDVQVNGVSVVENKVANINPATKEKLGVVKVGDGLNVTDGTISVDTTAIGTGNYIPYEDFTDGIGYWFPYKQSLYIYKKKYGDTGTIVNPEKVIVSNNAHRVYVGSNTTGVGVSVDYNNKIHSILTRDNLEIYHYINDERYIGVRLNKEGISLLDGDNNHVLTSHGSTIDITQYAKKTDLPTVPTKVSQLQNDSEFIAKSVYDEKIAALEARIAALEAKHVEV